MTVTTDNPAMRETTLPTARLLVTVVVACAVVAALWTAVVVALGQPRDRVMLGAVGAAVVTVASTVALAVVRPWRPKPLMRWPHVWVAGSFLRMAVTIAGCFLLYSAPPFAANGRWLALAVGVAYVAAMVGETRVYAVSMRRFAPDASGTTPSE